MKNCPKCKKDLPLDSFGKDVSVKGGLDCYCKRCRVVYRLDYYKRNREKSCEYSRRTQWNFRKKVLEHIQGDKNVRCKRCGFSDIRILQIDHINGGGSKERRILQNTNNFYQYILSLPRSKVDVKYMILCANCNALKRIENNECRKLEVECISRNKS